MRRARVVLGSLAKLPAVATDEAAQRAAPLQPGARPCSLPAWSRSRWRLRFNKGPDSCWNYARLKTRRTKSQVVFLASSAVRNARRKKASRMRCGWGWKGRRGWEVVVPRRPAGLGRPPGLRRPLWLGRRLGQTDDWGREARRGGEGGQAEKPAGAERAIGPRNPVLLAHQPTHRENLSACAVDSCLCSVYLPCRWVPRYTLAFLKGKKCA